MHLLWRNLCYQRSYNFNDFEDPFALENAMRNNKITGCIGSISFETGSNSIKLAEFMIRQLIKNDKTQKWVYYDVANVDKYSADVISIINPFIWHSDTSVTPSNYRPVNLYSFDDYLIIQSQSGKAALYSFSGLFFLISALSGMLSYKNFGNLYTDLRETEVITLMIWSF